MHRLDAEDAGGTLRQVPFGKGRDGAEMGKDQPLLEADEEAQDVIPALQLGGEAVIGRPARRDRACSATFGSCRASERLNRLKI